MYFHRAKVDCWSERHPEYPHKTVSGVFPSEHAELKDAADDIVAMAVDVACCESEEYHFSPDDEVVGNLIS